MAQAAQDRHWCHTSAVLAAIWSANGNLKRPRLFAADEFHPLRASGATQTTTKVSKETMPLVKAMLLGPQASREVHKVPRRTGKARKSWTR